MVERELYNKQQPTLIDLSMNPTEVEKLRKKTPETYLLEDIHIGTLGVYFFKCWKPKIYNLNRSNS